MRGDSPHRETPRPWAFAAYGRALPGRRQEASAAASAPNAKETAKMEPSPALSPAGTRTLLQEMCRHWPAPLPGGPAACLLLTAYPPVMVAFAGEWQRTGQPPGPCARLIPAWDTAVAGTPDEIGRLRRAAASARSRAHGPMPAEAGAARCGTECKAAAPRS